MSEVEVAGCDDVSPPKQTLLEQLRGLVAGGETEAVMTLVEALISSNAALQRQLEALVANRRFKTSEKVSTSQLVLLFAALEEAAHKNEAQATEALVAADAALSDVSRPNPGGGGEVEGEVEAEGTTKKPPPKPPVRAPLPTTLRRVQNPIRVPDDQRACPCCHGERECVGHDRTEVLERLPPELVVREDLREKLRCPRCEGQLCRAPLGDKVVSRGRLGSDLVACVLVEKYRDGLPLHRQVERFGRLGFSMGVSTLVEQVRHATERLARLHGVAVRAVLGAHVMQLDATGIAVQDRDHPKGKRLGSLWCYVGDGKVAAFQFTSTGKKRGQKPGESGPEDMLSRRTGFALADASGLFDKSFQRDDLIECGCNAHARRKFVEALDAGDSRAAHVLCAYKKLYANERKIIARGLVGPEKQAFRVEHSKPVTLALLKWCQAYEAQVPPSSPLGKALRYFINHHVALARFLEDPDIPIDNNLVERQQVRVALTRKNFLFVGNDEGGKRAALVYTMLACCALIDVDPEAYLADVLPRLTRGVPDEDLRGLLPDQWKAARRREPAAA
jgi:transposase